MNYAGFWIVAFMLFLLQAPETLQGADAKGRAMLKLRLGLGSAPAPALPNSVLWLAKDLGLYAREGLEVDLNEFQGTPLVVAAMIAGEVDVGNVSTSEVVRLTATKGQPMRAIHSPDARLYFLIAAKDDIKSVAELQGKTFAVARLGSVDHSLTQLALKSMGVNPANVTFVAIGTPSVRAQALAARRVDATTISLGTWVTIQKDPGLKVLLDPNAFFETATVVEKVNAVTTRVLDEKPDHLRRFTAAVLKASRHFADSQESWVEAITKRRSDVSRADAANLWSAFKGSWAVNGLMNLDDYKKSSEFFYQSGALEKVPRIEVGAWADTRFVDDVLREIGVYPRFDAPGRLLR